MQEPWFIAQASEQKFLRDVQLH